MSYSSCDIFRGYDNASLFYIGGYPRKDTIFKFTTLDNWAQVNAVLPFGIQKEIDTIVTWLPFNQKCYAK